MHLGEERFTPSYKSARNPETGTEEQVLGDTSYWLTCKLTSIYPLAQFKASSGDGPAHSVLIHPHQLARKKKCPQASMLQAVLQLRLSSQVCPGDNQNKHHNKTSLLWGTICKVLSILRLVYKASKWQYSTQQAKFEYNTYQNTSFLWFFLFLFFLPFFRNLCKDPKTLTKMQATQNGHNDSKNNKV